MSFLAVAIMGLGAAPAVSPCDLGDAVAMHVPAGEGPRPLVLVLHGSTSSGAAALRGSGLTATADRHGFVVVAPDGGIPAGKGHAWNIPGVPLVTGALPKQNDRDDVAYLIGIVDRLVRAGCVDRSRVYATGLSGGGRMASWLGCVVPRRVAAIAPVVGLRAGRPRRDDERTPDPATCRPDVPVPVLAFAGDADTTNPIAGGGAPYWGYSMDAAMARWAAIDRCTAAPRTSWVAPRVYEQRYDGCGGASVAARVTVGGGHNFAVADNEAMWAFLSRYTRP